MTPREPPLTVWGRAYYRALRKGYDHGYAAYVADLAEQRAAERKADDPS